MNPVVFQCNGELPADKYVTGQAQWPHAVLLGSALLQATPPTQGVTVITLEINGVLTGKSFTFVAGTQPVRREIYLGRSVPANQPVRWKVTASPEVEFAARDASITLVPTARSVAAASVQTPALSVRWVNGPETLALFAYTAATHAFAETQPGISAGRAAIVNTGPDQAIVISIQDEEVFNLSSGLLTVAGIDAAGGAGSQDSPRLEFYRGNQRLASLSAGGLVVPRIDQESPEVLVEGDPGFEDRFEFYSGGNLMAVLDEDGLVCEEDLLQT